MLRMSQTAPPLVDEVLRSSGQPLDPATRAFMEPRFGRDLSQVRVHSDSKAAESAQSVDALAYTSGHNIVFGQAPRTPRLLAHELAHVAQQTEGRSSGLQRAPTIKAQDSFHDKTAPDIDKVIAADPTIKKYLKKVQPLAGNFQVLSPMDYESEFKRWGKSKEDAIDIPGFTERGEKVPIKLRDMGKDNEGRVNKPSTIEDAVHETIHLNSKLDLFKYFGQAYNEGVTQYFAEAVLGGPGKAYPDERQMAKDLVGLFGEQMVGECYFNGDAKLVQTVQDLFKPQGDLDTKWRKAREKKDVKGSLDALTKAKNAGTKSTAPQTQTPPPPPAQVPAETPAKKPTP
jgi:hypothetical protein